MNLELFQFLRDKILDVMILVRFACVSFRPFFWISVSAEKDFAGANLVSVLHKLLSDEKSAPEIKYNSMILICAVMGSGEHYKQKGLD